jgi:hypothetical protein
LTVGLLVSAAAAGGDFDCDAAYRSSLALLERQKHAPQQLAQLSRQALRVYHACQTGDVHDVKSLFERLERSILEVKGPGPATN